MSALADTLCGTRCRTGKPYLYIVEQGDRAIKRVIRPTLNFKSFRSASSVLAGIELIHMIRKGQLEIDNSEAMLFADQFSAMAEVVCSV